MISGSDLSFDEELEINGPEIERRDAEERMNRRLDHLVNTSYVQLLRLLANAEMGAGA